jgi:cyclomaltodextrinase / maltogenic alpha-amylase / neopullulanase
MKELSEKARLLKLGVYQHFKGGKYRVVGVAKHSETLEEFVTYYDHKNEMWVRPLEMFLENVERDGKSMPRFRFISD